MGPPSAFEYARYLRGTGTTQPKRGELERQLAHLAPERSSVDACWYRLPGVQSHRWLVETPTLAACSARTKLLGVAHSWWGCTLILYHTAHSSGCYQCGRCH